MAYHYYFNEHTRIRREDIAMRADEFFAVLKEEFGKVILDEVCILQKLPKNTHYTLISGHSVEPKRRATDCDENKVIGEIEEELMETLKKGLLADGE